MIDFITSLGVAGMGLLIVFIGLICIIAIVSLMGGICSRTVKTEPEQASQPAPARAKDIPDREELMVAFSAAIAEELGTDVSCIRVVSFREI